MKIGIKEDGRTIWFQSKHYRLMMQTAYALWKRQRAFTFVFKNGDKENG